MCLHLELQYDEGASSCRSTSMQADFSPSRFFKKITSFKPLKYVNATGTRWLRVIYWLADMGVSNLLTTTQVFSILQSRRDLIFSYL